MELGPEMAQNKREICGKNCNLSNYHVIKFSLEKYAN